MDLFYSKYDIHNYFPAISEDAIDSLVAGDYALKVLYDSSLVVIKSPLDSIGVANILLGYKRHTATFGH
jgi:hypothetical protein